VTFDPDSYYYTEIYTQLSGDDNPSNDTSSVYSTTAMVLGDIVFELDAQGAVGGDQYLVGIEFDGTYFYLTSGNLTGCMLYVIDTVGTLIHSMSQPAHCTGWGWRDMAWDGFYAGPDRIDTLYASVNQNVDKFGIDLATGVLTHYGSYPGPDSPNRAMAWDGVDEWFFTANWTPCWKFSKTNPAIQTVPSPGSTYGAAYDTDPVEGGWVWWHSQTGPAGLQIDQMEPASMNFTGVVFDIYPTITTGMAGGLCFHEGFRGMDVLFALVQGSPDAIVGVFVRQHQPGTQEEPSNAEPLVFGFAPSMATVAKGHAPIAYTTTTPGHVSLKVYDGIGRLVQTLVDTHQPAGEKAIYWNNKDINNRSVANGVYFLKLEAEDATAVQKLILVK
jgi:hypothetical protein